MTSLFCLEAALLTVDLCWLPVLLTILTTASVRPAQCSSSPSISLSNVFAVTAVCFPNSRVCSLYCRAGRAVRCSVPAGRTAAAGELSTTRHKY